MTLCAVNRLVSEIFGQKIAEAVRIWISAKSIVNAMNRSGDAK